MKVTQQKCNNQSLECLFMFGVTDKEMDLEQKKQKLSHSWSVYGKVERVFLLAKLPFMPAEVVPPGQGSSPEWGPRWSQQLSTLTSPNAQHPGSKGGGGGENKHKITDRHATNTPPHSVVQSWNNNRRHPHADSHLFVLIVSLNSHDSVCFGQMFAHQSFRLEDFFSVSSKS